MTPLIVRSPHAPKWQFDTAGPMHILARFNELGVVAACGAVGQFAGSTDRGPLPACHTCVGAN